MKRHLPFLLTFLILSSAIFVGIYSLSNDKPSINTNVSPDTFDTNILYSEEWERGITYETEAIAVDLRRVCVNEQGTTLECDYFEYWTNNRTGNWEKLERNGGATEGSNFCEYFEEWKVAQGVPCHSLNGNERFVSY